VPPPLWSVCVLRSIVGGVLDTPTAAAVSVTVRPSVITANTARCRCSATLNSLIRECQGSTGTGVNHQPEPGQASTGTAMSTIKRSNTSEVEPPWGIEPQTYALREPLPVLTLALTRHVGCTAGIYRRLWPPQMTPVRTTNGTTPRSSRARQRPVARQRKPVRSPTSTPRPRLPAETRSDGAHPVRRRRCPTDTSPSHGGSDD
jgi:hypothetical protein